jgi:hypothetical protein
VVSSEGHAGWNLVETELGLAVLEPLRVGVVVEDEALFLPADGHDAVQSALFYEVLVDGEVVNLN